MKLYEIDARINDLLEDAVDNETGEINEEAFALIEELELVRSEKIEAFAHYIKNLRSDAEQLKAEKQKFEQRQKAAERAAERAQSYLEYLLKGEKVKGDDFEIRYRKSTACIVDDQCIDWLEASGRDDLVKVTKEARKAEIKKALQAGEEINGAWLLERTSMQIL